MLLHPLPLDGSVWDDVATRLSGEVAIVPSLYALGDTMGEWAAAVLDLLGPGTHTVVGNSVGASCAAEVAHLAPDRVHRLVMIGGKLGHRPEPALRDEAVTTLSEEGLDAAWARYWQPLFGPLAEPDVVERSRQRLLTHDVDDIIRGVRVFHGRADRSGLHERWSGRLDVVSGSHDQSPSPEAAALALEGAGDAQLHLVEGVGHYVPLEAPGRLAEMLEGPATSG